jgi:hypothetical protein
MARLNDGNLEHCVIALRHGQRQDACQTPLQLALLQVAEFDGEGKIAAERVSRSVDDYVDNCRSQVTVAKVCNYLKQRAGGQSGGLS